MSAPEVAAATARSGPATLAGLMRSRRFAALFWCQFFSAFNDNFVRNMLAMLILFRLGEGEAGALITLAVGVFMLPSLLLSGLGGEMADAWDKARLARGAEGRRDPGPTPRRNRACGFPPCPCFMRRCLALASSVRCLVP